LIGEDYTLSYDSIFARFRTKSPDKEGKKIRKVGGAVKEL
jgi:hypothetical protein